MNEFLCGHSFRKIERVNKGWSKDQKYYIETNEGERRLLRITDISLFEQKKFECETMKLLAESGIPMSQPLEFGTCHDGKHVYTLFTWCDGEDASIILPKLPESKQYELGVLAGKYLKQIHSISAPKGQEAWETVYNRKINEKIEKYNACPIKLEEGEPFISYIEKNRYLISEKPQSFHHGDYHVGNMIISSNQTLYIIDFNRYDFGDPWEEFNRIVFSATVSPHFATGQLDGYFNGKPPMEFFQLLALYITTNAIGSIPWAVEFGEKEINTMKDLATFVFESYDYMQNPVPSWYLNKLSFDNNR
ncbi:aminoglycoside phosphotransferase family protein [Fervidibacillus albus]|uniref:Phosphotransferase n=1 Tax=Fervidibacillus albus TaxID=2980026 RepID=A0A9E8LT42_9BACI|nr:phosphotransferase [Fervidibacillus albus]WAA08900.1 phosphotransferase [Fervidibacillus albus]